MWFLNKIIKILSGQNVSRDEFGVGISRINHKSPSETEVYFKVPSKKKYCLSTGVDEFTRKRFIKFLQVANYNCSKLFVFSDSGSIMLNIGFVKEDTKDLISFSTYQKSLKFRKTDKVAFLFEDDEIREFELKTDGYRIDKEPDGIIIESTALV